MLHWSYKKNDFPFEISRTRRHTPYTTLIAFNSDLHNAATPAANAYWKDVAQNPHALNEITNNTQRIQIKFQQKYRSHGGAQITPGWVGQTFVMFVSAPTAPDSRDHAYIFFKTGQDEINYHINKTFA